MSDPIFTIRRVHEAYEGRHFFVCSCTTGENVCCWRTDLTPIDDQKLTDEKKRNHLKEVSDE